MKILIISLIFIALMISFSSAFDAGTIIDNSTGVLTNPTIAVDNVSGVVHLVWSNGNTLIYTNSSSSFKTWRNISNYGGQFPDMIIDNNRKLHIVWNTGYDHYYVNSINWIVRNLSFGSNIISKTSIAISPNNTVFIAFNSNATGSDVLFIASSINFTSFSYKQISKTYPPLSPSLGIDSKGVIHTIWQYDLYAFSALNIIYSNSSSNYASEVYINSTSYNWDAYLKVAPDDNVYIAYKDNSYTGSSPLIGDIFLSDRNSNWSKIRITDQSTVFLPNRPPVLAIDSNNIKHIAWAQWPPNQDCYFAVCHNIQIIYTNSTNYSNQLVADVSFDWELGYLSIASLGTNIILSANIHSLASYGNIPINDNICIDKKQCKKLKEKQKKSKNLDDIDNTL